MLLKCTDCGHDVNIEAKSCPNCGALKPFKNQKLTAEQAKSLSFSERIKFDKLGGKIEMGKWQKISVGLIAVMILFMIFGPDAPKTPEELATEAAQKKEQEESLKSSMLQASCQTAIKHTLNDPDSADFAEVLVIPIKDNKYSIIQDLRAKNGFGAMMKGSFECVATYDGSDATVLSVNQLGQ